MDYFLPEFYKNKFSIKVISHLLDYESSKSYHHMDERHPGQIFLKNLTALKSSYNSVQCSNLNVYIDQAPEI
jgi:hypothetical protein